MLFFTNDDRQARLTLLKTVVNDNGGTAVDTDWTLTADGPTDGVSGVEGDPSITNTPVNPGNYTLTETGGPAGYTATAWTCQNTTGDPVTVTDATIPVALGDNLTCTITNNDQAAQLTLLKTVVNDNGGTAVDTDWTLTADGPTDGVSGVEGDPSITNTPVNPGNYTLTETGGPAGYTATAWTCQNAAGDPVTVTDATIPVALGDNLTCTITNNDQAAQLTLLKTVVNDNGGTAVDTDWTLTADGPTDGVSGVEGDPSITNTPSTPATTP